MLVMLIVCLCFTLGRVEDGGITAASTFCFSCCRWWFFRWYYWKNSIGNQTDNNEKKILSKEQQEQQLSTSTCKYVSDTLYRLLTAEYYFFYKSTKNSIRVRVIKRIATKQHKRSSKQRHTRGTQTEEKKSIRQTGKKKVVKK